jgi:hypothetical protein
MGTVMKTHLFLIGALSVLGTSLLTTSYAASPSEYLHLTRHRDSNGNLLMAPTQHQAESSVMQKTVMPSQPKTFERRSTDWGMSVQEVKENEPVQFSWELQSPVLSDYERRVAYHTQIEGVEAALTYTFYEDHLGQAKYVFEPQHDDAVEYVQDFHTLKNWISQSYGLPTSVQEIWLEKLYQYDENLWGQAIMRGHLVMVAEWKNPGTDIVLVLNGGDDTVGLVADFASTTFVVPVSFDPQSQEENAEEVIEETTIQEALPAEPTVNPMVEEVSVQEQEMSLPSEDSGEFHPETEVASQGPENQMQELEEIEQMLNEEYPLMEGGLMDGRINEAVLEGTAIETSETQASVNTEVINPAFMEEQPVDEQHLLDEGMNQNHLIEPTVDAQVPESAMDLPEEIPSEPSIMEEQATAVHPTDEHAMDEQHLLDEGMNQNHLIEPTVDAQVPESAMDLLEEMPSEPSTEEQAVEAHPTDEHAMNEHSNDHVMEAEAELDPQHL